MKAAGEGALPEGKATLKTEFTPDRSKEGGGTLKSFVDGKPAGEGKLTRSAFRHGLGPFDPMKGEVSVSPANYQLVYDTLMQWDEQS